MFHQTHLDIQLEDEAPEPASDDDKKKSPDDISNDKLIKAKKPNGSKGKGKKQ